MGDARTSLRGASLESTGTAGAVLMHSFRSYPAFRILFQSTLATNSAWWMWQLAAGWLALLLTESPFFVGLTAFASGIPQLIFALPSGVIVDRLDRRSVLLGAQAVVTVVSVVVSGLLIGGRLQPWHLLAATFTAGTAMSFVFPTRNALVANLVPTRDLANAVALNAAGQNTTRVLGPALAGPLIASLGVGGTFVACAAVQVVAVVVTLRLPHTAPEPSAARRTIWGSMAEGLTVIWRNEYLSGLIFLAAVPTMFLMPYTNLLPVFARDNLHLGSTGLGVLMAANGVGAVLGALAVAGWRWLVERPGVLVWSAAAFAVVVLAFALTPVVLAAGVLIFVAGAISAVYMALNNTKIQLGVDDAVRGRVLGVYLLTWGLVPVGTLPVGAAAGAYGAPVAVAGMAAVALGLVLLAALRFSSLRRPDPATLSGPENRQDRPDADRRW